MSTHVLLNLLSKLEKRDKMRGLPSFYVSIVNPLSLSLSSICCHTGSNDFMFFSLLYFFILHNSVSFCTLFLRAICIF